MQHSVTDNTTILHFQMCPSKISWKILQKKLNDPAKCCMWDLQEIL